MINCISHFVDKIKIGSLITDLGQCYTYLQSLRSRYQSEFIAISVIESVTRAISYALSFCLSFWIPMDRNSPWTYQRSIRKKCITIGEVQCHRFELPVRTDKRERERVSVSCGWWLIDFEAQPIHLALSRAPSIQIDLAAVTFVRASRISYLSIDP